MTKAQAMYSTFLQSRVAVGETLHPTGVEAFKAGVDSERGRIIEALREMDAQEGKANHAVKPSGVCRVCRAIAFIEVVDA